ncbi:DUF2284 domain-containing protein [Clostridium cagae]|uniref:DUF2284 domain-containing protein n=1 Tax=Clostridium cagae TaxID=2080751 RepID=UPI003F76B4C9
MDIYNKLESIIIKKSDYLKCKKIDLSSVEFDEKVILKCFHCKNYKRKWTCPPNIPQISYKKIFEECENALLVYCKIPFSSDKQFDHVREESTNLVHKMLLQLEKELYNLNEPLAISFIGGSCKLCKDGCTKEVCRCPQASRIPLEATGVNVIKLFKNTAGIDIVFPPKEYLFRVGLLIW